MPYLLLLIGLLFAFAALYRFFLGADAREIRAGLLAAAAVGVAGAALVLTVTGRLPVALAILTALWPLGVSYLKNRKPDIDPGLPLTETEAYKVLGLPVGAPPDDIRAAHIRLMKKVHPDAHGTDWLAQKINAAKDLLLNAQSGQNR